MLQSVTILPQFAMQIWSGVLRF